jgi:hypothetical protein
MQSPHQFQVGNFFEREQSSHLIISFSSNQQSFSDLRALKN